MVCTNLTSEIVNSYHFSKAFYKTRTIETVDVYETSEARLHCPEPFGYPEPLAAWVRNKVILQNSSSYMTLNLSTVQRSDHGAAIDCVVSNKHGSDYHRFIFNVKSKLLLRDKICCSDQFK